MYDLERRIMCNISMLRFFLAGRAIIIILLCRLPVVGYNYSHVCRKSVYVAVYQLLVLVDYYCTHQSIVHGKRPYQCLHLLK